MEIRPSSLRKRKYDPVEGFEAASRAWREMRELDLDKLLDPEQVVGLPYPGVRDPRARRPGLQLEIIGCEDVRKLLEHWDGALEVDGGLILAGGGKSCRLRVFACIQFVKFTGTVRILCIWNMMQATYDLLGCLRDALLFAYCEEGQGMWTRIEGLRSLEEVSEFMSSRRSAHSEAFWFILDGAQHSDVRNWLRGYSNDKLDMYSFLAGCKVLCGISPTAETRYMLETVVGTATCTQGFSSRALATYMRTSLLGAVVGSSGKRRADVDYYAGSYPWFLAILNDCCREVAADRERKVQEAQGVVMSRQDIADRMGAVEAAVVLRDEDDWEAVLRRFETDPALRSIEDDVTSHLVVTHRRHHLQEMIGLDPRYALSERELCTPYLEQLYIDVFRKKEAAFAKAYGGPWLDYCQPLIKEQITKLAGLDWICQRLCTDVVSRRGIQITPYLSWASLPAVRFFSTPYLFRQKLQIGDCICFFRNTYSFGHVDGAILYKDMTGGMHLVALQFTTRLQRHLHSADEFMSAEAVENWIPSVYEKVQAGQWLLCGACTLRSYA